MDRKSFIEKHKALFWYTPEEKKKDISDSLLVETILNEGTMQDVRDLYNVLTIQRVARVFFSAKGRQINNYYPEIYHYFSLVLDKYKPNRDAQRSTEYAAS